MLLVLALSLHLSICYMIMKKNIFLIAVLFFCTTPDCLGLDFFGRLPCAFFVRSLSSLSPRFNVPRLFIPRLPQLPLPDGTVLQRFAIISGLTGSVVGGLFISPMIAMTAACGFGAYACWGNVDTRAAIAAHRRETASGFEETSNQFKIVHHNAAQNQQKNQEQFRAVHGKLNVLSNDVGAVQHNAQKNHQEAMQAASDVQQSVDIFKQQTQQNFNKIDTQVSQLTTKVEDVKQEVKKGSAATVALQQTVDKTNAVVSGLTKDFQEHKNATISYFEKQKRQIQGVAKKVDSVNQNVDTLCGKVTQHHEQTTEELIKLNKLANEFIEKHQEAKDQALAAEIAFKQLFEGQDKKNEDIKQGIDYLVAKKKEKQLKKKSSPLNQVVQSPLVLAAIRGCAMQHDTQNSLSQHSRPSDPQMNSGNSVDHLD